MVWGMCCEGGRGACACACMLVCVCVSVCMDGEKDGGEIACLARGPADAAGGMEGEQLTEK